MSNSPLIIEYRGFAPALAKYVVPTGAALLVSAAVVSLFGPFSNLMVNEVWMKVLDLHKLSGKQAMWSDLYLQCSFAVLLLCVGFWKLYQRTSLVITPDGIVLPDIFAFSMKFRLRRTWTDVSQASIVTEDGKFAKLVLFFRSGGRAAIQLSGVQTGDLEKLTLAIQMRVDDTTKTTDLEGLLDFLHQNRMTNGQLSFTHIWEQDMNQRFAAVAFVPLDPGQTLQGGKLKVLRQIAFGGLSA